MYTDDPYDGDIYSTSRAMSGSHGGVTAIGSNNLQDDRDPQDTFPCDRPTPSQTMASSKKASVCGRHR
jgi:hypothetical protein